MAIPLTEDEMIGGMAQVLETPGDTYLGISKEGIIREFLLRLPHPPEPEAAGEAARLILRAHARAHELVASRA